MLIFLPPKICILLENIEIFQNRSKTSLLRTPFFGQRSSKVNLGSKLEKFRDAQNLHIIGKDTNLPKYVQNIPFKDLFLGQRSSKVNLSHKLA